MLLTSLALGALAIALAWPIPAALASAHWASRAPATALIVWQAVALAGGLSMIGALLVYGLQPFGDDLISGIRAFATHFFDATLPVGSDFAHMFALSGAILLTVHLLLNLALALVRDERSRRRHRRLIELLSSRDPSRPDTLLLDHEAPVAYCLPGTTRSMTVLSAGLTSLLTPKQLSAVIAHEQAHATQRHDLVLLAFRAWKRALPWFPIATRAQDAVAVLVEMLADDRARREVGDDTLAQAIARVALGLREGGHDAAAPAGADLPPRDALAASEPEALSRITRLVEHQAPLSRPATALAIAASLALLTVPTMLLVAPALLPS